MHFHYFYKIAHSLPLGLGLAQQCFVSPFLSVWVLARSSVVLYLKWSKCMWWQEDWSVFLTWLCIAGNRVGQEPLLQPLSRLASGMGSKQELVRLAGATGVSSAGCLAHNLIARFTQASQEFSDEQLHPYPAGVAICGLLYCTCVCDMCLSPSPFAILWPGPSHTSSET